MKNWRTTLTGILLSVPFAAQSLIEAYTAGYFTDKTGWQLGLSIAVIVIATILKDPKKINTKDISADGDGDGAVQPGKGL